MQGAGCRVHVLMVKGLILAETTLRKVVSCQRDGYFIAEQPAPAPHLAHPEGCAALRIVLVTVPCVSRACEHFRIDSSSTSYSRARHLREELLRGGLVAQIRPSRPDFGLGVEVPSAGTTFFTQMNLDPDYFIGVGRRLIRARTKFD